MKLKLLLTPILIILSIILLIWFVVPAFSNSANTGLLQKNKKFEKEKEKMESVGKKISNVEKLSAEIVNPEKKDFILGYVPENKKEEMIISSLNSLAKDNGASIIDLSIADAKEAYVEPIMDMSSNVDEFGQPIEPILVAPIPKAKELEVSYSIIGKYENLKTILDKIYRLKRFNKISSVNMGALVLEGGAISDNIKADMVLNFNYFKPDKSSQITPENFVNGVFESESFDMAVIEGIKNAKSTAIDSVSSGQQGKTNPFLP